VTTENKVVSIISQPKSSPKPAKPAKPSEPPTVIVSFRITNKLKTRLAKISKSSRHKNISETVAKAVAEYVEKGGK
jgi:hypothetical protein